MGRSKPRSITDIKSLARQHTQSAIDVLASVMNQPKAPPAARVAAAQALLDRGWGKPAQVVTGDESGLPISVIHRVIVQLPVPVVVEGTDFIENATPHDEDET